MFTTNIRGTALALTLGFGTLALLSSAHPAMAENIVSHTQSTVVAPAPSLLPATSTAPKAVQQKQIKRSTTINPDGTVETQAESSRTTYDAQGNLVTTTKSSTQSNAGGIVAPATSPAVVVRDGNNLTISRGGDIGDGNTADANPSKTGYGATRTGGRFNE